jgi:hypothetical protein
VFATIHDMNFPLYLIYRHHHLTIACTVWLLHGQIEV